MSGYNPKLYYKILSPFYTTIRENVEVENKCGHLQNNTVSKNKYCSECGSKISKIETICTIKFEEGFYKSNEGWMYKNFHVLRDNNKVHYILMEYKDTDIQSIKAAVHELEIIEQEMKQLGIKGFGGFISPFWD